MSRKSKSKDHTKALNIPLTLTQGDLLQVALAVTFTNDGTHLNPSTTRLYLEKTKKLLTLREAHDFPRCVPRSLVLYVCFVDRCLSFVLFLLAIVLSVLFLYFGGRLKLMLSMNNFDIFIL
jgi:hypothetical protein